MSTVERNKTPVIPRLVAGERLDRTTFHDRYEAMPPDLTAELIGGVVHMPPPAGPEHGDNNAPVAFWLTIYEAATPGVRVSINTSTALDDRGEPQPDVSLRILPEFGGQSRFDRRYIDGAPELIVEVARTTRTIDLGPKLEDYRRGGVLEYIVLALDPDELFWFERRGDQLEPAAANDDGLYRSKAFPGLWLDPTALLRRDLMGLRSALERGIASPDHADFVAKLARKRRRRGGP